MLSQIETILNYTRVDHIDSHVHTHSIPNIFQITAKLAKEYSPIKNECLGSAVSAIPVWP